MTSANSQVPEPVNDPLFAYLQPVAGGMAVERWNPGKGWLDTPHEKFAWTGILTCATCRYDLRPNASPRRAAFNIPDEDHPIMRLYCGQCCNDGVDEMERLTRQVSGSGADR